MFRHLPSRRRRPLFFTSVTAAPADNPTQDPALISSNSQFYIRDVSGQSIDQPLTIYFARPDGGTTPSISSALYNGTTSVFFVQPTLVNGNFASGDLYTAIGCTACNNSVNFANITAA